MNSGATPLLLDQASHKISKLVLACDWERVMGNRVEELDRFLLRTIETPDSRDVEGLVASRYIEKCIEILKCELIQTHSEYSAARWLWYVRRLPRHVFSGNYLTTLGYDRSLAESLSWYCNGKEYGISSNAIVFPISESIIRHVLRFASGTRLLSHFHSLYRQAGKGVKFHIPSKSSVPAALEDSSIRNAIVDYDKRHEIGQDFGFSGLGLSSTAANAEELKETELLWRYVLVMPCEDVQVPVRIPNEENKFIDAIATAKHALRLGQVETVLKPFGGGVDQLPERSNQFRLSLCLLMLFPVFVTRARWCLPSVVQVGYFAWSRANVLTILLDWLPRLGNHLADIRPDLEWPRDGAMFLDDLMKFEPSIWPLRGGGMVRSLDEVLLIDFAAATRTFIDSLEVKRHSIYSNARAKTFELQVQRLISESPWKPAADLLEVRGRSIRKSGNLITDVDAIGAHDNRLLLVSCKSVIYDIEYDKGSFNVVRNLEEIINKAVIDWKMKIVTLKQFRIGDNYDFSQFDEIIGIVCTPFVVYSSATQTLAEALPGIRASCSAEELHLWLCGNKALGSKYSTNSSAGGPFKPKRRRNPRQS